ncbi:MAG TPA: JAB domain-containing protein [Allosphingosinicella sp.]|jgi:DNA repair protein RadC|nr:JAB domain-containing protein [Allosphingosinicella sp.]
MIIATAREAADLLAPIFAGAEGEKLAILHLDEQRTLISIEEMPVESSDSVPLPVRAILDSALRLGGRGVVIAHNHPSGDPEPSRADLEATRRLAQTALNLGIEVHDHLIFAGGACRSFRELGLL